MAKSAKNGVTYILRDPKSKMIQPIHLIVRFDNDRVRISTGFKVLPKNWDAKRFRIKNVIEEANRDDVNSFLGRLEAEAVSACIQLKSAGVLTKAALKGRIEAFVNPVTDVEPQLFKYIREFIKKSPDRLKAGQSRVINNRTIQKYQKTLTVLEQYAIASKRLVDFDTIDLEFYHDFTKYLNDQNYATNTVGKYIQTLKVFMNAALDDGKTNNIKFKSSRFKVTSEESDSIFLTEFELDSIANLDLSGKPRLDRVRDLFLIGCYTGLRFSDLSSLSANDIKGGKISIEQVKTGGKVVIPCLPVVNAILAKYDGVLPDTISNQKMNDYIKEVCELAELNELERRTITKGGVKQIKTRDGWANMGVGVEKWRLVSVHTARRSFATNMYLRGIPSRSIMAITGHKTEKAFRKYIKLDENEHADVFQRAWEESEKKQG